MEKEIENAIAAYLETKKIRSSRVNAVEEYLPQWPLEKATIAVELTAVIAPLLPAVEPDWDNAPKWAMWRLDYADGSHNFSKGYPSITTTGVIRVVKRPQSISMNISTPPVRLNPEEAIKLMDSSNMDKCERCGCEVTGSSPCPFVEEINNEESMCNCCDECRHECAQNI